MSKTKSSETPHYELLYIIANKFSEDEISPIVEKVKNIITEAEGKITHTEDWGKKRLAYPIKSFGYGYYNLVEFDLAGANLAKVERLFRLMPEVLRHQIVRRDANIAAKQIKREAPVKEVKEVEAPKLVKEKTSAVPKTDLKDLDEKLDKILETNDLL